MSLEVQCLSPAHICNLKQLTCHASQLVAALVRQFFAEVVRSECSRQDLKGARPPDKALNARFGSLL